MYIYGSNCYNINIKKEYLCNTFTNNKHFVMGFLPLLLISFSISVLSVHRAEAASTTATVASPDGNLVLTLTVDDGTPKYSITRNGNTIVSPSLLGFSQRTSFPDGIASAEEVAIDEPYQIPHGKTSDYRDHCNQLTVVLDGEGQHDLTVVFRLYDDAVAFRYEIPERQADLSNFTGEVTEFNISNFTNSWCMRSSVSYEATYNKRTWSELTDDKYCAPMLIQMQNDTWMLLTEANNTSATSASMLKRGTKSGQIMLVPAENSVSIAAYPFQTPWRTMIIGKTTDIVESITINSLGTPTTLTDMSWIRPGRVSWNWGGQDQAHSGETRSTEWAHRYADLAAHMGWEYVLIDEGWDGNINLANFISYCKQRGVDVIIWVHQNKFQNTYGDALSKMRTWANMGVKGVKIDFFENDGHTMLQKYEYILRAAASSKMMIDFHGCIRPSGWERTWPNLMTMEGVYGGEMNLDWHHMNPTNHSVNLTMTRNVLGGMDFTPGKIGTHEGKIVTNNSWCNEMAMTILFESGYICIPDCPTNMTYTPVDPLYRMMPAAWDQTKCLEANPDNYATIARRSGDDWYVATVSQNTRTARINLSFLDPEQTYYAYIYKEDSGCRYNVLFDLREGLKSTSAINIPVRDNGGAVVILSPSGDLPRPQWTTFEAEDYNRVGGTITNDNYCSGGKIVTGLNGDKRIAITGVQVPVPGEYALTIYHKLEEGVNKAYVGVGSEEKKYYNFVTPAEGDHGVSYAIQTVYINLKDGRNTIYYGNENGKAPSVDKFVLTPTLKTQAIISGVQQPIINAQHPSTNTRKHIDSRQGVVVTTENPDGSHDSYRIDGVRINK